MTDTYTPEHAEPGPGWAFAAKLCQAIAADGPAVARRGVDRIRAEQPQYAAIDRDDHEEMVLAQLLFLLDGLAGRAIPTAAHAGHARLLGARRAEQGIPVEAVLNSFHIGYRELWNVMLDRTVAEDPGQAGRLLELVNLLWAWTAAMTSAAADGYAGAVRSREEARSHLGHLFLEALYSGQATAESSARLARAIGFDPQGSFQAICCPVAAGHSASTVPCAGQSRSAAGTLIAVVRATVLVVVFQDTAASHVLGLLQRGGPLNAGVGVVRQGLAGAADSIADAESAMAMAEHQGGIVDYGTDWLPATLLPHLKRLRPIIDPGQVPDQPHLRAAVRAYAAHGSSVTASAQTLHIHPNSMKYRLDRWQQLTGWNPRTLDGLLRSLLSISFAPREKGSRDG